MLFYVVEFVEFPEQVVPAFVWFEGVDSFDGRLRHAIYFAKAVLFVIRGAFVDREIDVAKGIVFVGRNSKAVCSDKDQLVSEMIQGASEVGKNVCNELA